MRNNGTGIGALATEGSGSLATEPAVATPGQAGDGTLPAWAGVTSAEVLAVFPGDRADLDGPVPGARVLGRDLDGLVQVGAVDHVVAADLLLGLGERPVADQQFPIADPHGGGVADVAQPVAVQQHTAAIHLAEPVGVRGQPGRARGRGVAPGGLVDAMDQHVPHETASFVHHLSDERTGALRTTSRTDEGCQRTTSSIIGVVGWAAPEAGPAVRARWSPGRSPVATTGPVMP